MEREENSEYSKENTLLQFIMQQIIKNMHADLKNESCDATRILKVMYTLVKDA